MHVVTRGKSVVQKLGWVFPLSLSQWSNEDLPDLYWIFRCFWKGCTMEVWKHDDMTILNIIWIVYIFSFLSVYWSSWCFNIAEEVRIIAYGSVRQCVSRIFLPDLFTDLTPPPLLHSRGTLHHERMHTVSYLPYKFKVCMISLKHHVFWPASHWQQITPVSSGKNVKLYFRDG